VETTTDQSNLDYVPGHLLPKPTPCEITPQQAEEWGKTKSWMQFTQPAFTHIFYKMMNPDQTDGVIFWTRDIPTLATDGRRMLANPDFFFKYGLHERGFLCCHEIAHNMFLHCAQGYQHQKNNTPVLHGGQSLPFIHDLANIAQDMVINAMLIESNVGKMPSDSGCYDKRFTSEMSWQEVYHQLFPKCVMQMPKQGGGSGKGQGKKGQGQGDQPDDCQGQDQTGQGKGKGQLTPEGNALNDKRFDEHMQPGQTSGQDPDSHEAQPNEQVWQQAIIGAMAVARGAGKLPAALEKKLEELLKPKVSWTDHIEGLFARNVGRSRYDYRRLDRRLVVRDIGAPGRAGNGAGTVVVGMDTSGSIYAVPKLIERFFGELAGILEEIRPKRIVVMWCDAQVHRTDEIEDSGDLRECYAKGAVGGGGTSFVPVFDEIVELDIGPIDALVYLTDGDGSFPEHAPDYPVIWGDISHNPKKYPFGAVVEIPNDGTA
jgi:predicted metal-dependent peptidase